MKATDPTELDANGGAGHSASVGEAPVFTIGEHLEYLVGLITEEWKKTMVKWHNVSANPVTVPKFDEMSYYNPDDDSDIKFQVGKVPEAIHHKVDNLQHMQRIGLPHLPALVELAKEELEKSPFPTVLDENGEEIELSFTDMLTEIAKDRLYTEYFEKNETGSNLAVVFVDQYGKMRLKQCLLQHDTDFASFLVLMDDYPQDFDLNVAWAASFWEEKIRELKKKGYDGHPKLVEVEQLIATHKTTNYDDGPKWMFFKTNQRVAYAKPIENKHDFKNILDIVTNPKKNNRLACMVRAVDKDLISISDELKFFEPNLQDSVPPTDEDRAPGIESSTVDDASFDFLARTLGVEFKLALFSDEEEYLEDKQLPWELMNIDKS